MTKKSQKRLAKDEVKHIERRGLNAQELQEYLELLRVTNAQHWRTGQIKSNTALVHNGLDVLKTEESISELLEANKNNWLSQVLMGCGVPAGQAVNINSETGEVVDAEQKDKTKD